MRIEVPANRYDLLCLEGIVRALKLYLYPDVGVQTYELKLAPQVSGCLVAWGVSVLIASSDCHRDWKELSTFPQRCVVTSLVWNGGALMRDVGVTGVQDPPLLLRRYSPQPQLHSPLLRFIHRPSGKSSRLYSA